MTKARGAKTTAKGRKAATGSERAANNNGGASASETLPTAEWIAEMVIHILGDDLNPLRRKASQSRMNDFFDSLHHESARNVAVAEAMNIYRAARQELDRRRRVPPPLPAGVRPKELENKRVTFVRGCKLITGEEDRDRAEEKYIKWREWDMGQTDEWDGMPEAEQGFSLTYLAEANASYQKNFEKALAWHKRQKKKNTGQKAKKTPQNAERNGTKKR